jgi:Glycosyl transferase family 2
MNPLAMAPVAVFAYKRADHLRRMIASLAANAEASATDLYCFCDGPRRSEDAAACGEVRDFLAGVGGFRSIRIVLREHNFGLARNIIDGVGQVLREHERVVVVEDDLLLSPYFLRYMNAGLETYAEDALVASIHGYCYPVRGTLAETFFLKGADCWGWATWRRAWAGFRAEGQPMLDELLARGLSTEFDFDDTYPFTRMLRDQIAGRNDSWAIRWNASCFLAGMLTLYPGRSLVHNTGNDASGTHSQASDDFAQAVAQEPVVVRRLPLQPSKEGRAAFVRFFREQRPGPWRRFARVLARHWQRLA